MFSCNGFPVVEHDLLADSVEVASDILYLFSL